MDWYVEHDNRFDITVSELLNNVKVEKTIVVDGVVYGVMPDIRAIVHKNIFSNIRVITEEDMATINYGIYKVLALKTLVELDEDDFYESAQVQSGECANG